MDQREKNRWNSPMIRLNLKNLILPIFFNILDFFYFISIYTYPMKDIPHEVYLNRKIIFCNFPHLLLTHTP